MKAIILPILAVLVTLSLSIHAAPPAPAAGATQGVEKIVKATVAEMAKNGEKFKGVIVELTGVAGFEFREYQPGLKEVVIKGEGGAKVVGKLTDENAKLAEKNPKFYVGFLYVDKRASEVRVATVGNTVLTEGDRPIWK